MLKYYNQREKEETVVNAAPYAPQPIRLSPTTRAVKEAAALLGRPGVWPVMLTTFLLCVLLTFAPFFAAECLMTLLGLMNFSPLEKVLFEGVLYTTAVAVTVLAVLPVWLGRLRLSVACFTGEDPHPRAVFYYLSSPRRWGRALAVLLLFALLLAIPAGLSAGLLLLCDWLYDMVFLTTFTAFVAAFFYAVALLVAVPLCFGLLLCCGLFLPFLAVAVGNDELRLFAALKLSLRAGKRNFGTCAAFLCRSFFRLLLGLLTVGVWQVLWNTHVFLLSYTRLSMALCPKGESL